MTDLQQVSELLASGVPIELRDLPEICKGCQ